MAKKKSSTSRWKKEYNKPKLVTLSDGTPAQERYHNDYGMSKKVFKKVDKDPEEGPAPKDAASKAKYPPPKKNKIFREAWMKFIGSVTSRSNFKEAHLKTLGILCDLYVEYEDLEKILRLEGRIYSNVTRFGEGKALHPAVGQLDRVRSSISTYTRLLDLFPKKDSGDGDSDTDAEAWS